MNIDGWGLRLPRIKGSRRKRFLYDRKSIDFFNTLLVIGNRSLELLECAKKLNSGFVALDHDSKWKPFYQYLKILLNKHEPKHARNFAVGLVQQGYFFPSLPVAFRSTSRSPVRIMVEIDYEFQGFYKTTEVSGWLTEAVAPNNCRLLWTDSGDSNTFCVYSVKERPGHRDVFGWDKVLWGMSVEELTKAFGSDATSYTLQNAGQKLVFEPTTIQIKGTPYRVRLIVDPDSSLLGEIQLQPTVIGRGETDKEYGRLREWLIQRYGVPNVDVRDKSYWSFSSAIVQLRNWRMFDNGNDIAVKIVPVKSVGDEHPSQ
jgi:hypothetical protein